MNIKAIYDNGGQSFDRYTVVFDDGSVFGMSHNATSPQGFCQYAGEVSEFDFNADGLPLGEEIDNVPLEVVRQAINICKINMCKFERERK